MDNNNFGAQQPYDPNQVYAQQPYMQQPYNPQPQVQAYDPNQAYAQQPYMQQPYNPQPQVQAYDPNQAYAQQPYNPQPQVQAYNPQPQMQPAPQAPKAKKQKAKGSSKNAIIIGVTSFICVAALIAFFIFVVPMLKPSDLGGRYEAKSDGDWYVFDNGSYIYGYDYNGTEYIVAGTYNVSGDEITLTDVGSDSTYTLAYDKKKNTVSFSDKTLKCTDEDELLPIKLDTSTIKSIEKTFKTATETALGNENLYEEAVQRGFYYIYSESAKAPMSGMEAEILNIVNYDKNETLQYLLEYTSLFIEINIDESGKVTVDAY